MSHLTIAALPSLGVLSNDCAKVTRKGARLRFRFRRTAIADLPCLAALVALGITVRVYTGATIHDLTAGTTRATPVLRPYTTVEVCL